MPDTPTPRLALPGLGHNSGSSLDEDHADRGAAAAPRDDRSPIEPRGPGRPRIATPELLDTIFERLGDGVPLRVICRAEGMPGRATIYRWRQEDPAFDAVFEFMQEEGYCYLQWEVIEEVERLIESHGARFARAWYNRRRQQLARQVPLRFGGE